MTNPSIVNVNRNWHFEIKPLYSFIMLLGITICFGAAFWQYQKSIFYQAPVAQILHMEGKYLNQHSHLLDNQTLNGQVGYAVITPFLYDHDVFLVNRGFIAYSQRSILPDIPNVDGSAKIHGFLKSNHKPLLLNTSLQDPVSHRLQFIDEQYFSALLNKNISADVFVLQKGKGLLTPFAEKSPYLSHHRHQAYALQWLLLGLCGVFILFIASIKRGESNG